MPSSPRLAAQIHIFIRELAGLLARAQLAVDGKMGRIPPRARKPVLIASAAVLLALLVALIGIALPERDPYAGWDLPPMVIQAPAHRDLIPPEELFLPDEPDFIPGVMLGRERREEWTAEDAEPWWRNPLADGEEHWRLGIERIVDEIMESVP